MRFTITPEEHNQLSLTGNEYCKDLASITAKVLAQFPEEIEQVVKQYLSDHTSLFNPYTAGLIRDELVKLREIKT